MTPPPAKLPRSFYALMNVTPDFLQAAGLPAYLALGFTHPIYHLLSLATVTWLFTGTVLHSDSLGSEQLISPGQLNLMTAGHGIAHAEEGMDTGETLADTPIMGVQMWLAQPTPTREGPSAFQHIESLPETDIGSSRATVFVGSH